MAHTYNQQSYQIARAKLLAELQQEVISMLKAGWGLVGGPFAFGKEICQAMQRMERIEVLEPHEKSPDTPMTVPAGRDYDEAGNPVMTMLPTTGMDAPAERPKFVPAGLEAVGITHALTPEMLKEQMAAKSGR